MKNAISTRGEVGCWHSRGGNADREEAEQPGAEEAEVVAGGGEDDVDGAVAPGRKLRSSWPSSFMCPITGSMPARRPISLRMVGMTPRFCPETNTRCLSVSWPR